MFILGRVDLFRGEVKVGDVMEISDVKRPIVDSSEIHNSAFGDRQGKALCIPLEIEENCWQGFYSATAKMFVLIVGSC